jgi:hypothetical protein
VPVQNAAAAIEIAYGLAGQDAVVLASVLTDLEAHGPSESCFLNKNARDFDDPDIRDRLENCRCKYFARFAAALT